LVVALDALKAALLVDEFPIVPKVKIGGESYSGFGFIHFQRVKLSPAMGW